MEERQAIDPQFVFRNAPDFVEESAEPHEHALLLHGVTEHSGGRAPAGSPDAPSCSRKKIRETDWTSPNR